MRAPSPIGTARARMQTRCVFIFRRADTLPRLRWLGVRSTCLRDAGIGDAPMQSLTEDDRKVAEDLLAGDSIRSSEMQAWRRELAELLHQDLKAEGEALHAHPHYGMSYLSSKYLPNSLTTRNWL